MYAPACVLSTCVLTSIHCHRLSRHTVQHMEDNMTTVDIEIAAAAAIPATPILIFTSDASDTSTSSTSSPSEVENNWGPCSATKHEQQSNDNVNDDGNRYLRKTGIKMSSRDTAYATLYHGYGRPLVAATDFDDLLLLRSKHHQQKPGAPATSILDSTNSNRHVHTSATFDNNSNSGTSCIQGTTATVGSCSAKRRHSSSYDNAVPYRQSSLKWKQRNGSATFELKISQGEFMTRS